MKAILIVLMCLLLTACGWNQTRPASDTIEVTRTYQPVVLFHPPPPIPLRAEPVQWFVITRDNLEEQIAEVEALTGQDFVLFGVTPRGYENMAINLQDMRRFILNQREIIRYYQEVTREHREPLDQWLELNRLQRELDQ